MTEETLASEKLVTSCAEVHYPENFLNPHYLHLILGITSDMELISTTESPDYFTPAALASSLTTNAPDNSVLMTLLALCLRCSDVSLAQWLTPLPPSDLCSNVTLLTRPLLSNLFKITVACLPTQHSLPPIFYFILSFAMICVNTVCFKHLISALPLPPNRR